MTLLVVVEDWPSAWTILFWRTISDLMSQCPLHVPSRNFSKRTGIEIRVIRIRSPQTTVVECRWPCEKMKFVRIFYLSGASLPGKEMR